MLLISTNDFRSGSTFMLDDQVHMVLEATHVKQARGQAFVRTRIRNMETGVITNRTFRAAERHPRARVESRPMQYLYADGSQHHFMDAETFDQIFVTADLLEDALPYLKEGATIDIQVVDGKVIGAQLPPSVELTITETEPGLRGDTVSGGTKPATLETGAVVQVPLFVNTGETIRVDTRTGNYIERV